MNEKSYLKVTLLNIRFITKYFYCEKSARKHLYAL
jgi:hypothetical protein